MLFLIFPSLVHASSYRARCTGEWVACHIDALGSKD